MESKCLMVGDLIRIKGHTCKVSYLAPFDIGDARLAVISNDYDGNPYLDEIEPIPLNKEMLEANSMIFVEMWRSWCYFANGNSVMVTRKDDGFVLYGTPIKIKFVHELQHALRLCGLNELADNFKVSPN